MHGSQTCNDFHSIVIKKIAVNLTELWTPRHHCWFQESIIEFIIRFKTNFSLYSNPAKPVLKYVFSLQFFNKILIQLKSKSWNCVWYENCKNLFSPNQRIKFNTRFLTSIKWCLSVYSWSSLTVIHSVLIFGFHSFFRVKKIHLMLFLR